MNLKKTTHFSDMNNTLNSKTHLLLLHENMDAVLVSFRLDNVLNTNELTSFSGIKALGPLVRG